MNDQVSKLANLVLNKQKQVFKHPPHIDPASVIEIKATGFREAEDVVDRALTKNPNAAIMVFVKGELLGYVTTTIEQRLRDKKAK